jgi:hypothetical protein
MASGFSGHHYLTEEGADDRTPYISGPRVSQRLASLLFGASSRSRRRSGKASITLATTLLIGSAATAAVAEVSATVARFLRSLGDAAFGRPDFTMVMMMGS